MMAAALFVAVLWHPFHVSVAEAQWNSDGSRLEVALRLHPRDLDAALSHATGRPVVLENESKEESRKLLTDYLCRSFFLSASRDAAVGSDATAAKDRRRRFHWVGLEQEIRYTWVYFELERPADAETVWLTNQVIFDVEPTQINTLQLLRTDPPTAIRTTRGEPTQPLPTAP